MTKTIEKEMYVVKSAVGDHAMKPVLKTDDAEEAFRAAWNRIHEYECMLKAINYLSYSTNVNYLPRKKISRQLRQDFGIPDYIVYQYDLRRILRKGGYICDDWKINIEFNGYCLCELYKYYGKDNPIFHRLKDGPSNELMCLMISAAQFYKHSI